MLRWMDFTPSRRQVSSAAEISQSRFFSSGTEISAGQGSWTLLKRWADKSIPSSMGVSIWWFNSMRSNPMRLPASMKSPRVWKLFMAHMVETEVREDRGGLRRGARGKKLQQIHQAAEVMIGLKPGILNEIGFPSGTVANQDRFGKTGARGQRPHPGEAGRRRRRSSRGDAHAIGGFEQDGGVGFALSYDCRKDHGFEISGQPELFEGIGGFGAAGGVADQPKAVAAAEELSIRPQTSPGRRCALRWPRARAGSGRRAFWRICSSGQSGSSQRTHRSTSSNSIMVWRAQRR